MNSFIEKGYISDIISRNTINSLKTVVLPLLPDGYTFLHYRYDIIGPPLFTYHRDVTSAQSTIQTRHPTYTVIHYSYEGNMLSVSPYSHTSWVINLPETIYGKKNTAILFNCDLVHAGVDCPPDTLRKATQYKVVHKDDLHLFDELYNIYKIQTGVPTHVVIQKILSIGSYIFTVPIQLLFTPLLQRRSYTLVGRFLQNLIPIKYFNN